MNRTLVLRRRIFTARNRRRLALAVESLEGRRLLSTINVDAGNTTGVENGSAASPFRTIQAAINKSAPSGDTISVAAGKYAEALTINHSVTLVGPNAGIDPNTGGRRPQAGGGRRPAR